MPRLQESIFSLYPSLLNCSGDEYSKHPTMVFLNPAVLLKIEHPKSPNFITPYIKS